MTPYWRRGYPPRRTAVSTGNPFPGIEEWRGWLRLAWQLALVLWKPMGYHVSIARSGIRRRVR